MGGLEGAHDGEHHRTRPFWRIPVPAQPGAQASAREQLHDDESHIVRRHIVENVDDMRVDQPGEVHRLGLGQIAAPRDTRQDLHGNVAAQPVLRRIDHAEGALSDLCSQLIAGKG